MDGYARATTPDPGGADIWLGLIGMLPQGDEQDEDDFLELVNVDDEWADDGVDWDLLEEQAMKEPDC